MATFGRDDLNGSHDIGVGQLDGAVCRFFDSHAEMPGDRFDRIAGLLRVDRHLTAKKSLRQYRAAHNVRIGNGGPGAASSITGRPG